MVCRQTQSRAGCVVIVWNGPAASSLKVMQQHFIRLLHTAPPPHIQPPVTRRLSSVPAAGAGDGEQLTERQPEGTAGRERLFYIL